MRFKIASIVVLSLLLTTGAMREVAAQQPSASDAALKYIPGDSLLFLYSEGNALWNGKLLEEVQKRMPPAKWARLEKSAFNAIEQWTGIPRQQLASATLVVDAWDVPQVPSAAMILASTAPLERAKLIRSLTSFFATNLKQFDDGHTGTESLQHEGVELSPIGAFPGKKLYAGLAEPTIAVIGDVDTLHKIITQKKRGKADGPLAASVQAAKGHDLALGLQLPEDLHNQLLALLQMTMGLPNMQNRPDQAQLAMGLKLIEALLDMKQMHLLFDWKQHLSLKFHIEANSEKAAVRFQRLFDTLALFGEFGIHSLEGTLPAKLTPELRDVKKLLTQVADGAVNSRTKVTGSTVDYSFHVPDGGPQLIAMTASVLARITSAADRMLLGSNLRQLAIAMHNYHNDYNKLPSPAYYASGKAVPAKPGDKPLLSWRVYLLPYLEADHLFKQFHLDEPWDSEHNKKLIPMMPKVFACPGTPDPGVGKTFFQVFAAPEKSTKPDKQMFSPMFRYGGQGITLGQLTVMDGTSNTMMIAEARNAVIWTKPDDLIIDNDESPLPEFGSNPDEDTFSVVFGDASVRSVQRSLPDRKLYERLMRQLIGRRDGLNEDTAPLMK